MELKAHAKTILARARGFTEMLLEQFQTDDDWFAQTHPNANHARWIVGHLGLADNAFASRFRPDGDHKPDGWEELFWFGSQINPDRSVYPDKSEVLAYFRDRREFLLKTLDELSDEEINAAAPGPEERSAIAGAPNVGHIFLFAAFHEGIHGGQLTVAHRGLGHGPLMKPQPAEA